MYPVQELSRAASWVRIASRGRAARAARKASRTFRSSARDPGQRPLAGRPCRSRGTVAGRCRRGHRARPADPSSASRASPTIPAATGYDRPIAAGSTSIWTIVPKRQGPSSRSGRRRAGIRRRARRRPPRAAARHSSRPGLRTPAHNGSSAGMAPAPVIWREDRRIEADSQPCGARPRRERAARRRPGMITTREAPDRTRAASTTAAGSGTTGPGSSTAGSSPSIRLEQQVRRQLDVGRPAASGHRAAKRLADRGRDGRRGPRPADERRERLERAALVRRLVQDAAAEPIEGGVDLARQDHDRRRVRPGLGDRREGVERARAGRRRAHARDARGPGRTRRRRTPRPARAGSGCAGSTASPARASYSPRVWIPGIPNTVRTDAACKTPTTASPTRPDAIAPPCSSGMHPGYAIVGGHPRLVVDNLQ